jgi:DNA gyrase subunit A
MLATRKGMSIRFPRNASCATWAAPRAACAASPSMGRPRREPGDRRPEATFLVCTENGYGKRTAFDEYRPSTAAASGIIAIRTSERNGKVVGAHAVRTPTR